MMNNKFELGKDVCLSMNDVKLDTAFSASIDAEREEIEKQYFCDRKSVINVSESWSGSMEMDLDLSNTAQKELFDDMFTYKPGKDINKRYPLKITLGSKIYNMSIILSSGNFDMQADDIVSVSYDYRVNDGLQAAE